MNILKNLSPEIISKFKSLEALDRAKPLAKFLKSLNLLGEIALTIVALPKDFYLNLFLHLFPIKKFQYVLF
jgi:hypothetical protein